MKLTKQDTDVIAAALKLMHAQSAGAKSMAPLTDPLRAAAFELIHARAGLLAQLFEVAESATVNQPKALPGVAS